MGGKVRSAEAIARKRAGTRAWKAANPERVRAQTRKDLAKLAARRGSWARWYAAPRTVRQMMGHLAGWSRSRSEGGALEVHREAMADHDAWLDSLDAESAS